MKQAAIILDNEIRGYDAHEVINMHDEVQLEVEESIVPLISDMAEYCIAEAGRFFDLNIPLAGEAKVGNTWAVTH